MNKKVLLTIFIGLFSFLLSGCWNYISLDQMALVTGIAIDNNKEINGYHLTFEIIDIAKSSKENGIKTTYVESDGKTLFDAIRNAKKRVTDKLYFSNAQIVILNKDIAKEEGVYGIINWFLRDAETRETLNLIISKEQSAKDIIMKKGVDNVINSYEIKEIINEDNEITSSTINAEMYQIYNILNNHTKSLSLPVVHCVINAGQQAVESNGIATFDGDKLMGFLSPEETKYFLFITGKSKGGILTVNTTNKKADNISLEISQVKTTKSFTYKDNLHFTISIKLEVFLAEDNSQKDNLTEKQINVVAASAAEKIKGEATKLIRKVQNQYDADIFGFDEYISQTDHQLWSAISKNWNLIFKSMSFDIKPSVSIVNTAYMK